MIQSCAKDERLLDYLYGELVAEEAVDFSCHLDGCPRCQGELAGYRRVREATATHLAAPGAGDDELLERITRSVMAQAEAALLEARPGRQAGDPQAAAGPAVQAGPVGGGQVLPFRQRRPGALWRHPALGVLAAAAMALIYITSRKQPESAPPAPPPGLVAAPRPAQPAAAGPSAPSVADPVPLVPGPAPPVGATRAQRPDTDLAAADSRGLAAPGPTIAAKRSQPLPALAQLRRYLQKGRCAEAEALLDRMDQDPAQHGAVSPGDRAALERCAFAAPAGTAVATKAAARPTRSKAEATKRAGKAAAKADAAAAAEALE